MEEYKNLQENNLERLLLGKLASGENVYDKPNGHVHHTIKEDLASALSRIDSKGRDEIVETVALEGKQWKLFKVKIVQGEDDLFLAQRINRRGLSVFVKNKQAELINTILVILKKNDPGRGQQDGYTVITAYAGEPAPREPWDMWFEQGKTAEEQLERKKLQEESFTYWKQYAFIPDNNEFPIVSGTECEYNEDLLRHPIIAQK